MGKGRKPNNSLPEFVDLSEDGKKVRCKICNSSRAGQPKDAAWIKKESLVYHLKSDLHARAVIAQRERQSLHSAREHSIQQEIEKEERMDFVTLASTSATTAKILKPTRVPAKSVEEETMWDNYQFSNELFNAGINCTAATDEERKRLEREANEFDIWHGADFLPEEDPNNGELLLDELEQDDILTEFLRNANINAPDAADMLENEIAGHASQPKIPGAWAPYESKLIFLLDTLDNLPRMRISNSLMKVFLWVLSEAGACDVPSFYHLRLVQASIRKSSGIPTIQQKSPKGNVYSMNDPRTLVAMDWANPSVCDHIRRYPVIPLNGTVSEVYHARKWHKDVDRHTLSPMYAAGDSHYYIDELACLKNGDFVIPVRWLEDDDGNVFADAFPVIFNGQSVASVIDSNTILIQASDLLHNFLDLVDSSLVPTWSNQTVESGHPGRMPNPDRSLADGDPLYTSWIDVFGDDVSGNRSKSWNKHFNTYISHRNLPRKFLQQEFHTHFVSTSPDASVPEQFHGIKQIIEYAEVIQMQVWELNNYRSTHKSPVRVRHGTSGETVRFKIYVNCGPGDNPAQSEICGHIGGNGNHPCRKCHVGGTQQSKETDIGYHSMFEPAAARSGEGILLDIKHQVELACLGIAQTVQNEQTKSGIKDAYTQYWIDDIIGRARTLRKNHPERTTTDIQNELLTWVHAHESEIYNPFLTLAGFDPAVDTPVEILHTILLGIVKYLWHGSHTTWTPNQKQTYSVRLQSTDRSGLSIHAIRANYIMQYANSLIGRQFKTIVQVNVFHVYDLVNSTQFLLTKAVGELAALLWIPEIKKMEEYISDIEVAVANVLDLFALIDPSKMISKLKLHLLVHLKSDILRFGPLVGLSTEVFECFNAIFRFCSVFSNHLAPSRDIAFQLASQEALKHRLTGGWWPTENGEWDRPGPSVRKFMHAHPMLQALVGWISTEHLVNGSFKLEPLKRDENRKMECRKYISWSQTHSSKAVNGLSENANSKWTPCRFAIARSGDKCFVGSWIFAASSIQANEVVTGRIVEILANETSTHAVIALDIYQILSTRHATFGMPMLAQRYGEISRIVIPSTAMDFLYNAQHDCPLAKCTASGQKPVMQERVESGLSKTCIEHKSIDRFVINTHAFHNAHLLRATLPRSLVAPIPLYQNREAKHREIAASLRPTQESKRLATKARAAQKKQEADIGETSALGPNKRTRVEFEIGQAE